MTTYIGNLRKALKLFDGNMSDEQTYVEMWQFAANLCTEGNI